MKSNAEFSFLQGGGEMGELIRATNWDETPLGTVENWPQSLKLAVGIILSTPFPMYIAWGPAYTQLYNDGYRPILGSSKHPQALGISTRETFKEIWHIIGSMFGGVLEGKAVGFPNFMLPLDRNGYIEECFFDFSYSPIRDESGNVGGVLVTVVETTDKINTLKELEEAKTALEISKAETEHERDRLKAFFMQAPAGICILDGPMLVFELVNAGYQQFFPGRALLGKPLLEAMPELEGQPIVEVLYGVYHRNETFQGEALKIPLARTEGGLLEDRYFNFIYQPRRNQKEEVDGILVFAFEVSDMVLAKAQVEESEKRFRQMVEESPVPMLVSRGEEMVFEEINQPMLDLIGRDASVKGKSAFVAMPELKGQPVMENLFQSFQSGEPWHGYEQPIVIDHNGEQRQGYYNLSYKPLREDGKVTGVLQSAIDVTEQVISRKKLEAAEDTLKLAIAAARMGTFDMDLVEGTMEWDARCRQLFGISHPNPVSYEHDFVGGLHPEDRNRVLHIIDDVFNKAKSNGNYDVEYRTLGFEDQKLRWVKAMGKAYFNEDDRPVRFIGAVLDITERKEDEARKNDFIGMVSHELKTPLTSLSAYIQLLEDRAAKSEDAFSVNALSKVGKQTRKMGTLINGFLNVSRLEAGKIQLAMAEFSLDELVKDLVDELKFSFSSHEIVLETFGPVLVEADEDKIGSVISNLLSNAFKYSPKGGLVTVRCSQSNDLATVSVRDQGIGIASEDVPKLFERYYRVQNKESITISGFGIGLYLSAEIIQRHAGQIWVESEPGKGSEFFFSIPLKTPVHAG